MNTREKNEIKHIQRISGAILRVTESDGSGDGDGDETKIRSDCTQVIGFLHLRSL